MTIETRRAWDGGFTVDFDTDGGDFEPAVVAPPVATPLAERDMVAFCIDSVTFDGTDAKPNDREVRLPRPRHRIVIDGEDFSFARDVQTPQPQYALQSPLLYGSGMLVLPQFHAAFEHPGAGDMAGVTKDARVKIQRVDADDNVVATDFIGSLDDFRHDGRTFSAILAGEAVGPCSSIYRPMPIFPQVVDVGTQVMRALRHQIRLSTANEPTTGVEMMESGAAWHLDWLNDILAKSDQRDGTQWTVMPNQQGQYRMSQKDTETIDATVYIDGARVAQSLRRDFTQEFNRVWAQGINPDGMRERFAIFPGLLTTDLAFGGTTLHPGDTGDDVTALIWRLYSTSYLDQFPPDEWTTDTDDPVTAAIEDVQEAAGLTVTGNVNAATWKVIFQGDNYSLRRSTIRPAAQKPFTHPFLQDATGNIIGDNPAYDKSRRLRDVYFDMGAGFRRRQIHKWAKGKLRDPDVPNWVGTITIHTGAVIDGEHNPGDPLTTADILDARALRPGMNLWLANWYGGTLVHIAGITVNTDGTVELAVDSQARDTMPVWQVIQRNKQSKKSPARIWDIENRRSHLSDDTGAFYDGGPFGKIERTFCPADTWTVIPTPGGKSGTLQKLQMQFTNPTEVAVQIWDRERTSEWCDREIGDWATPEFWAHFNSNINRWKKDRGLIDHWGNVDQPAGYGHAAKTDPNGVLTGVILTGEFIFEAGAPYFCHGAPVLWIAVRPLEDSHIEGGRVLQLLLDDSAG